MRAAESRRGPLRRMALISLPKTKMRPESGRSRPLVSLSRTLLPTPAGPSRMRVSPVSHLEGDVFEDGVSGRSQWRHCRRRRRVRLQSRQEAWRKACRCSPTTRLRPRCHRPKMADQESADHEVGHDNEDGGHRPRPGWWSGPRPAFRRAFSSRKSSRWRR